MPSALRLARTATCVALVLLAPLAFLPAQAPSRTPLTVARIVATPTITGTAPAAPAWSPDSRTLAFLWSDRAMPARDLWVVGRDGSGRRRLTPVAVDGRGSVSAFAWVDATTLVYLQGATCGACRSPRPRASA